MDHAAVLSVVIMYTTSLVLSYLITGSLCLLTTTLQFPHSLSPPVITANVISFSVSLGFCFVF